MANFKDYKLCNDILKSIEMLNYKNPTEVQEKVIPIALNEKDIIVKSKTGSGKTASFAIPVCELVDWDENKPQALVLTPTRELALQITEDFFNIGRFKRIKTSTLIGKAPIAKQDRELKAKNHVVIGTPGRVIDHIDRGTFNTEMIKYLIVDEADEMLNMGFLEQLEIIIDSLPSSRTTMLFSATLPANIQKLCDKYMNNPTNISIDSKTLTVDAIKQQRYDINEYDKISLMHDINIVENPDSCIIFCNTQYKVNEVYDELKKLQYTCNKLHGGMEQNDRFKVIDNFKKGRFRYLVATDVAARGIDVDNITHVINYDLPRDKESYVHRIGRTGRAEKSGTAISFVTSKDSKLIHEIEDYIGKTIPMASRPTLDMISKSNEEFIEKLNTKPILKKDKGHNLNKEIMKLHINAGKKTKMRPVDIVGTLCNIKGITADDIGIITILDVSTFVEILNNKGELVLEALQTTPIKGRLRNVTKKED